MPLTDKQMVKLIHAHERELVLLEKQLTKLNKLNIKEAATFTTNRIEHLNLRVRILSVKIGYYPIRDNAKASLRHQHYLSKLLVHFEMGLPGWRALSYYERNKLNKEFFKTCTVDTEREPLTKEQFFERQFTT